MPTKTAPLAIDLVSHALSVDASRTVRQLADAAQLGKSTVGKQLKILEAKGQAVRSKSDSRLPEAWRAGSPAKGKRVETKPGRLGSGELRALVLQHLEDNAGESFTPTAIGKVLRRSSGAVTNALVTLCSCETSVAQVSDKPKRFAFVND